MMASSDYRATKDLRAARATKCRGCEHFTELDPLRNGAPTCKFFESLGYKFRFVIRRHHEWEQCPAELWVDDDGKELTSVDLAR